MLPNHISENSLDLWCNTLNYLHEYMLKVSVICEIEFIKAYIV